jgi:hypothetical protein
MSEAPKKERRDRRRAGRRSIGNWVAWTAGYGCLPFLFSLIFHLIDSGHVNTPADLFQRGDALLVAIAFFGSGLGELHRVPKGDRPDIADQIVAWTAVTAALAAALFGYMWPRIDGGTVTSLQKDMLGWVSLAVLLISIGVGLICVWLARVAEWDAQAAASETAS